MRRGQARTACEDLRTHWQPSWRGQGVVRNFERPDTLVRCPAWRCCATRGPDASGRLPDLGAAHAGAPGDPRRPRQRSRSASSIRATNALARGLRGLGVGEGDAIRDLLPRPPRLRLLHSVAASKLGASLLLLNTSFAAPQIAQVCENENPRVLIYDEEFTALCAAAAVGRISVIAWQDSDALALPTIDELDRGVERRCRCGLPRDRGRVVILTSGTTGSPKGASRHQPRLGSAGPGGGRCCSRDAAARARGDADRGAAVRLTRGVTTPTTRWGWRCPRRSSCSAASTPRRRSPPSRGLRPTALIVVPVMLTRIRELGPETICPPRHQLAARDRGERIRCSRAIWRCA